MRRVAQRGDFVVPGTRHRTCRTVAVTEAGWWASALDPVGAALQPGAARWQILLLLAATTLLLEDAAIAAGATLAAYGSISWLAAFGAVAAGIALGDLALYAAGSAAGKVPWLYLPPHCRATSGAASASGSASVAGCAAGPCGAGLAPGDLTPCGIYPVAVGKFFVAVSVAVLAWTGGLPWISATAGAHIADRIWRVRPAGGGAASRGHRTPHCASPLAMATIF